MISFNHSVLKLTRRCHRLAFHTCSVAASDKSSKASFSATRDRVVLSGIQPMGSLHIGNYFGAVQQWLHVQKDPFSTLYIQIADLHSVTEFQHPDELYTSILDMAAALLACGIDPQSTILFQQSSVPYHAELAWLLSGFITIPALERMGHYKEKSSRYRAKAIPPGLLMYPVLQAADILLYRATHVPVGQDQEQHLQLCHHILRSLQARFNVDEETSNPIFPYPEIMLSDVPKIKSLRNPDAKMSKSDPSDKTRIQINDTPDEMRQKIRKALTDFTSEVFYEPELRPAVSNLMIIHRLLTGKTIDEITTESVDLNTAQYKQALADQVVSYFGPIHKEYVRIRAEEDYIRAVLEDGRIQATETAEGTMRAVRRLFGLDIQVDMRKYLADEAAGRRFITDPPRRISSGTTE